MFAKIYAPRKNAMQSGRGVERIWRLEFTDPKNRSIDPLMGWTSADGGSANRFMQFETKEAAVRYAEENSIPFFVEDSDENQKQRSRAYSDNFAFNRRQPWTH